MAFAAMMLTAQAEQPVKVYILSGQSNMQGKASVEGDGGSLRSVVKNDTKKEFQFLVNESGEWVERNDVWIHFDSFPWGGLTHGLLKPGYGSSGGQIGPELGFGHVIGAATEEQVLLIKVAWGGKALSHEFLPPSIGKYPKPVTPSDPGYHYQQLVNVVRQVTENITTFFPDYKGQGIEIAGFGWHQGWNDQYGEGNAEKYETNMAAFIRDIRSAEHGVGVPNLPFVIATSGNIYGETPIKDGQRAMADATKYPDFAGNVAVVDTDKPYGPDKMTFKFDNNGAEVEKVDYHWNSNAKSYTNIGRAMAQEMLKLTKPKQASRLIAHGSEQGVQLLWQLGSEKPYGIDILRNGKSLGAKLSPTQTTYLDAEALPGVNTYELVLKMPSGEQKLSASCDTSATDLIGYRSVKGVMLSWKARGKYDGFLIKRDGKVIADKIAADARTYEDATAPEKGKVTYSVEPTAGKVTPVTLVVNRGPADSGGALVYEPFDYPADNDQTQHIVGKGGIIGTKGTYVYASDSNKERAAAVLAQGLSFGELPVTGNRCGLHRWSADNYIELDDSLKKAGLLEDGATLWISYVYAAGPKVFPGVSDYYNGGGAVSLRNDEMKQGIGLRANSGSYDTMVIQDGKETGVRIAGTLANAPQLVVARITWGKDGQPDKLEPFKVGPDLKLPDEPGRAFKPAFNIDQSKLTRLVYSGMGQIDEIRVGATFESVVGKGK